MYKVCTNTSLKIPKNNPSQKNPINTQILIQNTIKNTQKISYKFPENTLKKPKDTSKILWKYPQIYPKKYHKIIPKYPQRYQNCDWILIYLRSIFWNVYTHSKTGTTQYCIGLVCNLFCQWQWQFPQQPGQCFGPSGIGGVHEKENVNKMQHI